jgi:hypothetical protein
LSRLERPRHIEDGGRRPRVAGEARGHGAHARVDRPAVGQFDDRPVPRAQALRVGGTDGSLDLDLRGIGDAEQFGLGLDEGAEAGAFGGNAPRDRARDDHAAAVARYLRCIRCGAGALRLRRGGCRFGLRPLIIHARRHALVEQGLLALEILLRERRACIGRDPFCRDLRGVAALDDCDRLAGANRIAEPLEQPGHRAARACRDDCLAARRGGDGRLRDDFGAESARVDRLDADLRRLDLLGRDDEAAGQGFTRRFLAAFGRRGGRRIGGTARDAEARDGGERHGARDSAEKALVLGDHILSPLLMRFARRPAAPPC